MSEPAQQLSLFDSLREPDSLSGFSVRRSKRARRLSVKVYPRGRVEVVVPRRTSARDVQAFVAENREWIDTTRAEFARLHPPEPFALPVRIELPAISLRVRVSYRADPDRSRVHYRYRSSKDATGCDGGHLELSGPVHDAGSCVEALRRWLAAEARRRIEPQLRRLSALTGNGYRRLQVRGQRTCWGSHSSRGTVSVNYCLLFVAPELLRYLLVHELCHARHMNHSRRFWREVGRFEPDYRRLDKALGDAWMAVPTWVGIY